MYLHSETCVIQHLCNLFQCVIWSWFSLLCILNCVIGHPVYSEVKFLTHVRIEGFTVHLLIPTLAGFNGYFIFVFLSTDKVKTPKVSGQQCLWHPVNMNLVCFICSKYKFINASTIFTSNVNGDYIAVVWIWICLLFKVK